MSHDPDWAEKRAFRRGGLIDGFAAGFIGGVVAMVGMAVLVSLLA